MMGQLGIGTMLGMLGGNDESAKTFAAAIGKVITGAELADDALTLRFADGTGLRLVDRGQSCCERRYLKTDDDLTRVVGATLVSGEVRPAPGIPDEYGDHEVTFLDVQTSAGLVQVCAHNEHNGYYGGFWIVAEPLS